MKKVKRRFIILALILAVLVVIFLQPAVQRIFTGGAVLDSPPTIPHMFFGTVSYVEIPETDLEGCEITAYFNEENQGGLGLVKTGNEYDVRIETQGQGGQIIFYIGEIQAQPIAESESFVTGEYTNLDLIINDQPDCSTDGGDNNDNGNSGGGGGGSGGGGGGSQNNNKNNNNQNSQESPSSKGNGLDSFLNRENNENSIPQTYSKDEEPINSKFTGAVVEFITTNDELSLIAVVAGLIIVTSVILIRQKLKNPKSKKDKLK